MAFTIPVNRPSQPFYNVGSALRSPLDLDDLTQEHKKTHVVKGSTFNLAAQVQQLQTVANKLRRRKLTPPLPQSETAPLSHPFKIYQPDKGSLPTTGLIFDADGNPSSIAIDSTVPTNLPTTVNPNTDWWRFWAVRNGIVEYRPFYNVYPDDEPSNFNYSESLDIAFAKGFNFLGDISGVDNVSPYNNLFGGLTYDDSTTNVQQLGFVLIVDGDYPNSVDNFLFGFWIQIVPDTNLNDRNNVSVNGSSSKFPADSPFIIPIGILIFNDVHKEIIPVQYLFGHAINRWSPGMFSDGAPSDTDMIPGVVIYRGNWQNDDIQDQVFYPGDVIYFEPDAPTSEISHTYNVSGGSGTVTANLNITTVKQLMMTAIGFTSDPSTDPNFITIGESIKTLSFL